MMSSGEVQACPKTCGRLSTAAIFICVGVVQLLSGIVLLQSEHVFLLAGIDFLAAISNVFVGGSLGVSSSVWEKKENRVSTKNVARQNVLAGLYITVMAVNATTAIIMVMGDGNKLLNVPETDETKGSASAHNAASFIAEILACAYVASVCSPIVCTVVALVCLSGNRIRIYETVKSQESKSKESSGWIYDKKKVKLSDVLSPPSRASVSEDSVFFDKKAAKGTKALLKGHLQKASSTYALPSISEIQSPLEFLAQKRKEILEEIASPQSTFFADDYLQFPEFKYGPYVEKILPRIKQSSMQPTANINNSKETEFSSGHLQMDQVNEPMARQRSYSDSTSLNTEQENGVSDIFRTQSSTKLADDVTDSRSPRHNSVDFNSHSMTGSLGDIQYYNPRSPSYVTVLDPCEVFMEARNIKLDSTEVEMDERTTEPSSSRIVDFKADTINELKSILKVKNAADRNLADESQADRSSRGLEERQFKYSDADIAANHSEICYNHAENVFSENTDFDYNRQRALLASKLVPVAVRSPKPKPVSGVQSFSSSPSRVRQSSVRNFSETDAIEKVPNDSKRATSMYVRNPTEKYFKECKPEYQKNSSTKHFEKKRDVAHKISSMGSIAELNEGDSTADSGRPSIKRNADSTLSSLPPKRSKQTTSNTNLLKKLWSVKDEGCSSLSGLIMDTDSLVGLSDEQLMARTNRIRLLRKSVQVRSKAGVDATVN